jgi:CHAT domain-containing protein/tetratricopeptide (TPR) repeat protein
MTLTRVLLTALLAGLVAQGPRVWAQAAREPGIDTAPPTAADVKALLRSADALLQQRKGDAARPLFEQALAAAEHLSLDAEQAHAHGGLAEILFYATQYAVAREHGAKALDIATHLASPAGVARASHILSMIEELSGNGAAARSHAERAVAAYDSLNDRRGRAMATLQLLRVARVDIDTERRLYERTIEDSRAAGDSLLEGRAQHSLGDHLFTAGRYEEALEELERAEVTLRTAGDAVALGTVFNSLGRVYRAHGRLDEALKSQLAALELHEKAGAPFEHLQSLNAVATVYQRMGDLKSARRYYERALALAEQSSSQRVQDLIRANLGSLLIDQGQFVPGARALETVIANGLDVYPSLRYSSLSAAYAGMARPRDALEAASKAVERCVPRDENCIAALRRRAAAHAALGDPQAALADVNSALAALETVRTRLVPVDFFKQDFHHAQEEVYSEAIALQIQQKRERLALETAELARSRAFIDLLASREVRVKDRDQAQLASLQTADAHTEPRIALAESSAPIPGLTFRGGGTAIATTPVVSPAALELRSFVTATPSAADDLVATAARLQSTLVTYWVGDGELFVWVVRPDGAVHARRVAVLRSRLLELIRETTPVTQTEPSARPVKTLVTRGASTVPLTSPGSSAWRALYDLLIQPVRSVLPRASGSLLTIVPQGPLLNVSFAALLSPQGRYLLEDYMLHYAPAGAVLQFTAPKRRADARSGSALVVADPTLPRLTALDRPLPRLPGARQEASAIARLLPASRLTLLQDRGATEAQARDAMSGKAVLHFATHAVVSDDDPLASNLALGPSGGDGRGDGLLTSQEVYGLDLNADLVVLSACRSAGGRITGDGISAFARAFIYAGTASLVASLWDVADEPTSRLLPDFYRAWLGGQSKSAALRGAQLRLLRDLRAGRVQASTPAGIVSIPEHPVFWAGFALFGEPD